ncbi:16S rRNA (uracil(1498)-N(3))-methyltransferase [Metamycoplasma hyosynoviae]|uniref:Ribosomal RNA small subunit methyltransferase E n=2 Tax=Metamycoplasma hyosynoviae TaxID=29559 RepID=A0A9Q9F2X5_9BACT|nr:16S rRNA (uracil(1498)-N(3))-methyltransferase [Metamycoplasma hyosynoviae]MDC8900050.1 16S rRNA (uracil(1498)-N(3))-methyltransferase [Metamycoplasma hyosynoviae]MDC8901044.1 16S rRNA (uracil(1498)-N(3))-methyltransferase [Metamycoplasma hyosynoviae]MDC8911679.1 16S rRNA (uracil(1498)-N(3))-methyltransferase [Metamycoplasma hyosynoviae]MDC8912608.1 16S rRNA (uracil(1498)-N(3))-methyltransferase [Metamycoplasma hyosynoviae]MDC8913158.1 16S rRNA (uracil(1498)-N(3))-methyltransferase [Metamyc
MDMYKIFATKKENNDFIFDETQAHHLKVLRLRNQKILVNYETNFYECFLEDYSKAKIIEKLNINNELGFEVVVAIPIIKQANFEIALQKSTELGASKIIPFISEHTDKSNINVVNKIDRNKKILLEAAQQSFRNVIPELSKVISFDELINLDYKNKVLAYENAKNSPLEKVNENIVLIVGPEGGFSLNEIEKAKQKNVKIVSLTKSILRSETALIYMLSKVI